MITTSDIIKKLLDDNGYKTLHDFSKAAKISQSLFAKSVRENTWTKEMLARVGAVLGKDLSNLVTATIGFEKYHEV